MTTLYVHPANSSEQDDYESNQRQYDKNSYSSKHERYDHNDHALHYQSPHHLNRHQSHQHFHQYNNNNNNMTNDYSSPISLSSVHSVQSSSSSNIPPPPKLFFPVDDECIAEHKNIKTNSNINRYNNNKINTNANVNTSVNNNNKMMIVGPNLPALPPLSALTSNDGELLLNIKDLSRLKKLSVSEIKKELNDQRLKNETLLAKLHNDQKKFVKVCKHYEKKNSKLQNEVTAVAKKNKTSVQSAKQMRTLLVEHKSEVDKNQKEHFQCQISKSELWKGRATNMQLLSHSTNLNKQIDAYHLLIAKKNQEKNHSNVTDDQKDREEINLVKQQNNNNTNQNINNINDDDSKEVEMYKKPMQPMQPMQHMQHMQPMQYMHYMQPMQSLQPMDARSTMSTMSIPPTPNSITPMCAAHEDPTAKYAQQLIARNQRYHEILALLRQKVDELRACRKKL